MRTGTVRIAQEFLCRLIGFPEGTRILGARNAQERDPDGLVDVVEVLVASDQLPNWPGENPPLLSPTFRRDSAAELPTLVSWGQAERSTA